MRVSELIDMLSKVKDQDANAVTVLRPLFPGIGLFDSTPTTDQTKTDGNCPSENQRRLSAKERVLALLQTFGRVDNVQLNEVCFRYGARIYELRKEGHVIERCSSKAGGVVLYLYRGHSANYDLPLG